MQAASSFGHFAGKQFPHASLGVPPMQALSPHSLAHIEQTHLTKVLKIIEEDGGPLLEHRSAGVAVEVRSRICAHVAQLAPPAPPADVPPADDPPAEVPPAEVPPVDDPPSAEPPAPAADEPPASEPPEPPVVVDEPPVDPPAPVSPAEPPLAAGVEPPSSPPLDDELQPVNAANATQTTLQPSTAFFIVFRSLWETLHVLPAVVLRQVCVDQEFPYFH